MTVPLIRDSEELSLFLVLGAVFVLPILGLIAWWLIESRWGSRMRLDVAAYVVSVWFGAGALCLFWRYPWFLVVALPVASYVLITRVRERLRRKREGYWIDHMRSGHGSTAFFVIYHEPGNLLLFTGEYRPARFRSTLTVPSIRAWRAVTPSWAHERRDLILARVLRDKRVETWEVLESDHAGSE